MNEGSIKIGNNIYRELERKIDKVYSELIGIEKSEKEKRITSNGISWRTCYMLENDGEIPVAILSGLIDFQYFNKSPKENFFLINNDFDSKRILKLHDLIMDFSNLAFSETAKLHRNQMEYIRKMTSFNLEDYSKIK